VVFIPQTTGVLLSIFKELADYYDKEGYRFVLRTPGEGNQVQKLLERRGADQALCGGTTSRMHKLASRQKMPR